MQYAIKLIFALGIKLVLNHPQIYFFLAKDINKMFRVWRTISMIHKGFILSNNSSDRLDHTIYAAFRVIFKITKHTEHFCLSFRPEYIKTLLTL